MGSRASGGMRGVGGAALDTKASIICRLFCLRRSSRSRNQTRKEPDLLPPQMESDGQREGADVRCDSAGGGQPVREPRESDEMRFGRQAGAAPEEQKCARCVLRELARQKEAEYNQPGAPGHRSAVAVHGSGLARRNGAAAGSDHDLLFPFPRCRMIDLEMSGQNHLGMQLVQAVLASRGSPCYCVQSWDILKSRKLI